MMLNPVLLDQKKLYQHGPWCGVRRWWKGVCPHKGTIAPGWSGLETVEEKECFLPLHVITLGEAVGNGPPQAA